MKDYMKIYKEWLDNPYFDEATKEELRNIDGDAKSGFTWIWNSVRPAFAVLLAQESTV